MCSYIHVLLYTCARTHTDDGLECVTEPQERQERIKQAALFSWHAYQYVCCVSV